MIGAFRKIFSKSKKSVDPPPNPKPSKNPPPPQVSQATLEKLRKAKAQIKQSEVEETPSTSPPETQAPNAVSTAVATPQAKPEPPSPVPSASPRPVTAPPSAVQPNPVSVPEDLEDTLGIPFGTILDRLPESVQNDPGMAQAGSEEINIPKFKVFEKLAEGKILFTLKELIQWAPTTSISSMEELGSTQIEFPIKDILSRLDLKTLPRRKNQRKTEVPKGIEPSFGPRGIAPGKSEHSAGAPPLNPTPSPVPETQTTTESKKTSSDPEPQNKSSLDAFRIKPNETTKVSSAKQSTPELKKTSPSGSPTPSEKTVFTSPKPSSDSLKAPASPLAAAAMASGKPEDDSKPISFGGLPQSTQQQEQSSRPSNPIPTIGLQTTIDDDQDSVEDELPSLPSAASTKPPAASRKPSPEKEPVIPERDIPKSPSPTKLPETGGPIEISVEKLSGKWPEAIQLEIEANQLTSKVLVLPPDPIGKALKIGKLAFSWKEIKSWLPDTTAPESVQDSESLELPMSVVVPLFMAAQKPKLTGKKVEVDLSIPAVFDKPGRPTEVSTSIIEEKESEESAPASPELATVDSKDNFKAIIQKSLKIPGVAGSILAGKEGLILEGSLPDVFDKDGFAGILPQIFDRVNHYAGEIKLGSLETMGLVLDKVPLQVWKIGNFYFAVLGKKGESLPIEALTSLVKKLATISN